MLSLRLLAVSAVILTVSSAGALAAAKPEKINPEFHRAPGLTHVFQQLKLKLKPLEIPDGAGKTFGELHDLFKKSLADADTENRSHFNWAEGILPKHTDMIVSTIKAELAKADVTLAQKLDLFKVIQMMPADAIQGLDHKTDAIGNSVLAILKSAANVEEFNTLTSALRDATGFKRDGAGSIPESKQIEAVIGVALERSLAKLNELAPSLAELRTLKAFKILDKKLGVTANELLVSLANFMPEGSSELDFFSNLAAATADKGNTRDVRKKLAETLKGYWEKRIKGGLQLDFEALAKDENFGKVLKWAGHELVKGKSGAWSIEERDTFITWVRDLFDKILKALRFKKKDPEFKEQGAGI